jgi:hypothetical protein
VFAVEVVTYRDNGAAVEEARIPVVQGPSAASFLVGLAA